MPPGSISTLLSPLVPPLERDSKEKPPEAALPCCCHCKGAARSSRCSILPPPATQLPHFPRVKRGKQKACVRKWGLARTAACSTVLCCPPHSKSTRGVTAPTSPRQRCCASPLPGQGCVLLLPPAGCCPAAMAKKHLLSLEITLKPLEGLTSPDRARTLGSDWSSRGAE